MSINTLNQFVCVDDQQEGSLKTKIFHIFIYCDIILIKAT